MYAQNQPHQGAGQFQGQMPAQQGFQGQMPAQQGNPQGDIPQMFQNMTKRSEEGYPILSFADGKMNPGEQISGTVTGIRHFMSKFPGQAPKPTAAVTLDIRDMLFNKQVIGQRMTVFLNNQHREAFISNNVGINDELGLMYHGKFPNRNGSGRHNRIDVYSTEAQNSVKVPCNLVDSHGQAEAEEKQIPPGAEQMPAQQGFQGQMPPQGQNFAPQGQMPPLGQPQPQPNVTGLPVNNPGHIPF